MPGCLKVIEKCTELNIKVNMGHSDATYRQAMEGKKAGSTGITHLFNAMRPFHHREPGLAVLALLMKTFIQKLSLTVSTFIPKPLS